MANRTRNIAIKFFVLPQEWEMFQSKMEQYGTTNLSAYLRRISIDGYVVHLELAGVAGDGFPSAPILQQPQPAYPPRP